MNKNVAFVLAPSLALAAGACAKPVDWELTSGPVGAKVLAFASGNAAVYAGTFNTVFRSDDSGATWTAANAGLPVRIRVTALAAVGDTVFAGSFAQGLWRSTDRGASWTQLTDGFTTSGVVKIVPTGDALYALGADFGLPGAAGDVFVSLDHGDSWTPRTTPEPLASLAAAGNTIIGGGIFGSYRSSDHGQTWTLVPVGTSGFPFIMDIDGRAPLMIAFGGIDQRLYRSADSGFTWQPSAVGLPGGNNLRELAATSNWLLALNPNSITPQAYRSADGLSWAPLGPAMLAGGVTGLPQVMGGVADTLLLGADGVFRSTDAGGTWGPSSTGMVDTPITSMAARGSSLYALVSSESRVHKTTDAGETWTASAVPGPAHVQARSVRPITDSTVIVGTSVAGVMRSTNAGATWTPINNGITQYIGTAGTQYREIDSLAAGDNVIFAGAGASFERTGNEEPGSQGPSLVGGGVFRSLDGGDSWHRFNNGYPSIGTNLFGDPLFQPVSALAVFDGKAFLSGSGALIRNDQPIPSGSFSANVDGAAWVRINDEDLPCEGFAPFSAFAKIGDVVLGATPCGGVARLDAELNRWFPSGFGLPALPVNDLAVRDGLVYASVGDNALDPSVITGVYVSTDAGSSWTPAGTALQQRPISSLAVTDAGVFAGSSAGVWRLQGACPADFNSDGAITSQDFFDFLAAFFNADPAADFNRSGAVDSQDFFDFLSAFFVGC